MQCIVELPFLGQLRPRERKREALFAIEPACAKNNREGLKGPKPLSECTHIISLLPQPPVANCDLVKYTECEVSILKCHVCIYM